MKNISFIWLFAAVMFFLSSCNNQEYTDKQGRGFAKGIILGKVKTISDSSVQYAMYLPTSFKASKKQPVIFFFDPQGDVYAPLLKYKALAEQYGFVMVCNPDIKNGQSPKVSKRVYDLILKDVVSNFEVDKSQVILAGFSGGAKLAMLYAQEDERISGVIASGATLPISSGVKPRYYFSGIVGDQDFNYLEARQTFSLFARENYDYTALVFNGAHQWPPLGYMELAIRGQLFFAMKTGKIKMQEKLVENTIAQVQDSIGTYIKKKDLLTAFEYTKQMYRWMNGLQNANDWRLEATKLEASAEFAEQMRKMQQMANAELTLRRSYIGKIEEKPLEWWEQEIENFKNTSLKQKEKWLTSKRLLNYISMVGYMFSQNALDSKDLAKAEKIINIYQLADPENYDVYLMQARYHLLNEQKDKMVESYRLAKEKGFNQVSNYLANPAWKRLLSQKEIQSLQ
jgi:hypothetical protein